MIAIKRTYEAAEKKDGYRILIDRLWPRGLSKEKAKVNLWLKEIAPSEKLRKWFSHDPEKWEQFKKKYLLELEHKKDLCDKLKQLENEKKNITLLYSAKDELHNNAILLQSILK